MPTAKATFHTTLVKMQQKHLRNRESFYQFSIFAHDDTLHFLLRDAMEKALNDPRIEKRLDQIMALPLKERAKLDIDFEQA